MQPAILHLYAGAMTQDLAVYQYSTWKDQHSTTWIGDPTATIKTLSEMHPQTAYIIFTQLVIISLFANVSLPKVVDPFPNQKNILNKLGGSCQTYINNYNTHTMATHYGGIVDTSMNNPESQDMDADIQDNYQEDINDLENIEPDHQARLKNLTHEIEHLWQTIKANNNDPMDAISHLE